MKILKATMYMLLMSCVSAIAADHPSIKSTSLSAPLPIWTGFYGGLNAGGIWGNSNSINNTTTPLINAYASDGFPDYAYAAAGSILPNLGSGSSLGFIGGGQIGYNLQPNIINSSLMVGLETDIQGIAIAPNTTSGANYFPQPSYQGGFYGALSSINTQNSVSYIGTVRGRFGYLFMPTVLIYATGGLAYGQANLSTNIWANGTHRYGTEIYAPGLIESKSIANTLAGWTAGGGAEWMFLQNWSTKIEYLYYDLGSASTNTITSAIVTYPDAGIIGNFDFIQSTKTSHRFNGNIVRAGVNYHFSFANVEPVGARF
jgi:outer membrane immunogenic protein